MADVEYKRLIMAGPMRWVVLTVDGNPATLAWFVKVCYTVEGFGNVLFVRTDIGGDGEPDVFAVYTDSLPVAQHLRDDIFDYTIFAGSAGRPSPASIVEATFESRDDGPHEVVESMSAEDGTEVVLSLRGLDAPTAYVRQVKERVTEVGAFAVPDEFALMINGRTPAGQPEMGPLAQAPPVGVDLQNLWYET